MRISIAFFSLRFFFCPNAVLSAADVNNGFRVAQLWCASCHIVSGDQIRQADGPPSFSFIAQTPGWSAERLAYFLLEPHPIMPNMSLSRKEAEDIAAYIAEQHR